MRIGKEKSKVYKTVDTDRLAPYPNMTEDDLLAFESWGEEQESLHGGTITWVVFVVLIVLGIFML